MEAKPIQIRSRLGLKTYIAACLLNYSKLQAKLMEVQKVKMNIMRIVIIDKGLKEKSDLGLKIKYINPDANNSV